MINSYKYALEKYGEIDPCIDVGVFTGIDMLFEEIENVVLFDLTIDHGFIVVDFSTDNIVIYGSGSMFLNYMENNIVKIKSADSGSNIIFVKIVIDGIK